MEIINGTQTISIDIDKVSHVILDSAEYTNSNNRPCEGVFFVSIYTAHTPVLNINLKYRGKTEREAQKVNSKAIYDMIKAKQNQLKKSCKNCTV